MRARLRTLLDQRATAWQQVQDIQARREKAGYAPTEEDGETYTRALNDVDKLSKEIEEEERADRIESAMNKPAGDLRATSPISDDSPAGDETKNKENYRRAFTAFLRQGMFDMPTEERQLLQKRFVVDPEIRAAAAGTPSAGGYTVPEEFWARVVETLKAFGGIQGLAQVLPTAGGNEIPWPTNDSTAQKGAILGENTQDSELDLVFGTKSIKAHMYTSKIVRVSFQLLQDSGIDIEAFLARKLGERIARILADHLAVGVGTTQPEGLTVGLTLTQETATVGEIKYDDLVELEHKIDPAYRARARYVLHDSVVKAARKMKDLQNRPLWVPQMAGGVPSTINGHEYVVDNSLPTLALGAKPAVFGDIESAYLVRLVNGGQVMRLTERYADYLQVGFLQFQRADAVVQDASAAAALVVKAA